MEFIGISYADRGIYVKKPATWDGFLQIASQRFGLSSTAVASLRVLYCDDMSTSSPRWEIDASAWPGVGPKSSLYLESNEDTQGDRGEQAGWPTPTGGNDTPLVESPDKEYNVFISECWGFT